MLGKFVIDGWILVKLVLGHVDSYIRSKSRHLVSKILNKDSFFCNLTCCFMSIHNVVPNG